MKDKFCHFLSKIWKESRSEKRIHCSKVIQTLSEISGKAVPDDRISLQAEIPHASWNSDGHAAIFDKKLFIILSFHEEIWVTWQLTYPRMQKAKKKKN